MVTPPSGSSELDKLLDQTAFTHTTFDEGKGPSATQPLPDVFRRRVLQVQRRFTNERRLRSIRQPDLPVSLDNSGVRVLRKDVLDVINIRLERAGISTKTIPEAFFAWMLPRNNANAADWNLLVNCPVFLPNIRLRQMFKMHRSTGRTEAEPGETLFYVRTFAFTLEEFTDLIQAMFEEGFGSHNAPYQLLELLQGLDPVTDAGTTIYIRYCGTTTQGSAWERHDRDLRNINQRDTSMRSIFFYFCQRMFPDVMEAVELDEFPDATLYGELDSYRQHTVDTREQAMIALFGPTTLLNTAKGGLNARFIAHETETTAITTLNTSLLNKLPWYNKPLPDLNTIRRYSQEVQDYAQSHPATTNTARYPIDDNVKDLIYNAAIPAMAGNFPIMVTIGSDLTPDAIERLKTWYTGGIASAGLMVDIFDDLARTELGYSHLQSSFVADMHQKKQLPFVDLYPWAKKEASDLNKALELLRMYLQAVKPIVVLTLGDLVSGVGVGSFHQQRGIKSTRIIEVLGTPVLSKFDEDVLEKADDNCCVIIPCFHPGSVRHSAIRGELVIRLLHMTLAVAWLAMDEATSLCRDSGLSKMEICQKVMDRVTAKTRPSTPFGKAFQKLKEEYLASRKMVQQMMPSEAREKMSRRDKGKRGTGDSGENDDDEATDVDMLAAPSTKGKRVTIGLHGDITVIKTSRVRWKRALEQLYLVCDCDIAEGDPDRPTRRQQIERLMCLSLGNLYGSNSGTTEKELREWLLQVPRGTLYFFAANSISEQVAEVPDLISLFLPEGFDAESDEWKEDNDACQKASSRVNAWIMQSVYQPTVKFSESAKHVQREFYLLLQKSDAELARSMRSEVIDTARTSTQSYQSNGQEVQVIPGTSGRHRDTLILKWEVDGKEYNIKDFRVPSGCVPLVPGDARYLYLIPEGLDIRDASGRSLGTGRGRDITLPIYNMISTLALNPLGKDFLALWERISGTTVDDAQNGSLPAPPSNIQTQKSLPASFFSGRQKPFDTTNTSISKAKRLKELQDAMPFQPGDAAWLINVFLGRQYPNGGTVDLGNPKDFPDGPSVWKHLASFLAESCYFNHPHRANLQAACRYAEDAVGMGKGVIANFSVMVSALRTPFAERSVQKKLPGRNTKRKVLTIGTTCPPNAVVDVDEPEERDLEDTGREQVLGDGGEFVDDDSEQEEERAALAAERQQAVRIGKGVSETMAPSSRFLPSSGGMMPTGDPLTREEIHAAAAERAEINRIGYSGFNPMATSTTAASTSTTKRAREESDSEDQPGKAKKPDRKRSPSPKKHAGTGAKEKDEDDDEEMLV
ncbi:hypothetical protein LTR10_018223 [Elasticomyces elasticus]|uniref:Uncharacterized protein n=1 Tax=Exophiala sideris TaxID=1016849 RepID=A0ABR0JIW6_9EURO|nr:hypothetical protein LTR10_018223 [Elasticomyces elasticus]KAK5034536.1 hypothetical protein LTS07_003457 [Exophiala sideris]KAK5042832.1 hypothetical protein LTR13_001680 [Exophiala sideris]KAK5065915.1 hypothetical protein LTR69_003465 [Exophiala sideris]KAK5185625.1 hypothetical protein LTR44_001674 [Eurotiomycetes sp. CCFEE 6388]